MGWQGILHQAGHPAPGKASRIGRASCTRQGIVLRRGDVGRMYSTLLWCCVVCVWGVGVARVGLVAIFARHTPRSTGRA